MKNIIMCFVLFASIYSCKEDEIPVFSSKPLINVSIDKGTKGLDSLAAVTFGFKDPDTYLSETVNVRVYLSGLPVDYDRNFNLKLSGDAIETTDYLMEGNATIKANELETNFVCTIKRSANLNKEGLKTLLLKVSENDNFNTGINNYARISFSDEIPSAWINGDWSADMYLGACSKTKYKFFNDMLGFYDLKGLGYPQLGPIGSFLEQKVKEYNDNPAAFGNKYGPAPMKDENGVEVHFKN